MSTKKVKVCTSLRDWLNRATATEKRQVAEAAGTTMSYLSFLGGNYESEKRPAIVPSAKKAKMLEEATRKITPDFIVTKEVLRPDLFE